MHFPAYGVGAEQADVAAFGVRLFILAFGADQLAHLAFKGLADDVHASDIAPGAGLRNLRPQRAGLPLRAAGSSNTWRTFRARASRL